MSFSELSAQMVTEMKENMDIKKLFTYMLQRFTADFLLLLEML
jgi:hypothetical protein